MVEKHLQRGFKSNAHVEGRPERDLCLRSGAQSKDLKEKAEGWSEDSRNRSRKRNPQQRFWLNVVAIERLLRKMMSRTTEGRPVCQVNSGMLGQEVLVCERAIHFTPCQLKVDLRVFGTKTCNSFRVEAPRILKFCVYLSIGIRQRHILLQQFEERQSRNRGLRVLDIKSWHGVELCSHWLTSTHLWRTTASITRLPHSSQLLSC
ncbi:hypothetical protein IWX47DRAFT_139285 [Phyllosticta citricarpa]